MRETPPNAHDWLVAHDRWLDWSGAVTGRAEGIMLWAKYHLASGAPTLARQLAEQARGRATDPRQPLALIAIHRFLGRLDAAGGLLSMPIHISWSR